MRLFLSLFFLASTFFSLAQDSLYTRSVIRFLASEKCYGRGYLKNGLSNAEKFIVAELKTGKTQPLFASKYIQTFTHPVNTFPSKCEVKINGLVFKPGFDFIPDPGSGSASGKYKLEKKDSITYVATGSKKPILIEVKRKLTYSVAPGGMEYCALELDRARLKNEPAEIELNIKNKVCTKFKSNNIGCFINGSSSSDTMVVFTAHYDHLGGLGNEAFFPGANDNASGVSVLLNLVKHYTANPPKYKTVFIFFAGEEAGLVGSKFFVENTPIELKKIKFLVNLDLLGTGDDGIMVVNGAIHHDQFKLLNKINTEKNLVKEIKKRGRAANSDHYWFSEKSVPCFFIYTTGGIAAYHDVYDIEKTLPLTDYKDVFRLLTDFVGSL